MRPIWPAPISTNHSAPSPPLVMPTGPASVVIRPMAFAWFIVNHSALSEPSVIIDGKHPVAGRATR
jgi:hypothetical protein